jgi:splicing factor U2AF subunit
MIVSPQTRRPSPEKIPQVYYYILTSPGADLIGNVYARFKYEDSAQKACDALNSRWYAARPIYCELSPVTDFREACCRLNSGEGCVRGGFCNFIHRKEPSAELDRELTLSTKKWLKDRGRDERSQSRSVTPEPTRKRG